METKTNNFRLTLVLYLNCIFYCKYAIYLYINNIGPEFYTYYIYRKYFYYASPQNRNNW